MDVRRVTVETFMGQLPLELNAQKILRTGLVSISKEGIFTKEQRQEMEEISQRGSATKQILNHIAMRVQSNKQTFSSRLFGSSSPTLDPILQQAYEAALAPGLTTSLPSSLAGLGSCSLSWPFYYVYVSMQSQIQYFRL